MKHPLKYGIFAHLGDSRQIVLSVDTWVSAGGLEYWEGQGRVLLQLVEVEVEVPSYADLVRRKVQKLEDEIIEKQAETQNRITQIRAQIQDLLAIEAPKPAPDPDNFPF